MRLTPLDIRKQEFKKGMRGLDSDEVYAFLSTIADEYEAVLNENKALRERVLELDDKVQEYRNMEKTLRDTLLTAERVTVEAKDNARREADLLIKEAQIEAEKGVRHIKAEASRLREQIQNLRRHRDNYLARVKMLAESHAKFLDSAEEDFAEEEKKLDAERKRWEAEQAREKERSARITEVDLPAHGRATQGPDRITRSAPKPVTPDPMNTPLPPGPDSPRRQDSGDTRAGASAGGERIAAVGSTPSDLKKDVNEVLDKMLETHRKTHRSEDGKTETALSANTAVEAEEPLEGYDEVTEYTPRTTPPAAVPPAEPAEPDKPKPPSEWSLDRLKRDILSRSAGSDEKD